MEESNWRLKIGKKDLNNELDWRIFLHKEFVEFVEKANELAIKYDWDFWGGGVNNYAITLSQSGMNGKSISIKMLGRDHYHYYVSFVREWNPNNVENSQYLECIGKSLDETLEYLKSFLEQNKYEREYNDERICVMGGAYERYPLALKWAMDDYKMHSVN